MRRAYAIGVLDSIEDTLKVHMYWRNGQGLRVKTFVVCCLLFNVRFRARVREAKIDVWVHVRDFLNFMFEMPLGILKLVYCILKDAIIAIL